MAKSDIANVTYEVVSDDFRTVDSTWADTQLVKDLIAGKTIRVSGLRGSNTLYRIARANGHRLRSRASDPDADGNPTTIIWMVPEPVETEVTELDPETVTA